MSTRFQELLAIHDELSDNPLTDFIQTKQASLGQKAGRIAGAAAGEMGKSVMHGIGATLAGAATTAIAVGAQKAYHALTRERDFRQMMEANPDLHSLQEENPGRFNMAFNSLRSMNPGFSADPHVAAGFMRLGATQGGGAMLAKEVHFPTQRNQNRSMQDGAAAAASSFRLTPYRDGPSAAKPGQGSSTGQGRYSRSAADIQDEIAASGGD